MNTIKDLRVVFPSDADTIGGPGTFQILMTRCLRDAGAIVLPNGSNEEADLLFVIGGTRKLRWIKKHKQKGAKVLQRLDGIRWRHWIVKAPLKYKILCMIQNRITSYIRSNFADVVVYQSEFVQTWWDKRFGKISKIEKVVTNGTDLSLFCPKKENESNPLPILICVEGNIELDQPTKLLLSKLHESLVIGRVIGEIRLWGNALPKDVDYFRDLKGICFMGRCQRELVPEIMRDGDIFLSLDVNAACPNSVIEAMACGLPVVGYDTGGLRELVPASIGGLVDYGSNPWKLEIPHIVSLIAATRKVASNLGEKKQVARAFAEKKFGTEILKRNYLSAINQLFKI